MDINRVDEKGETVLFSACRTGDIELIKFLINRGANVKHINKKNETCLSVAIKYKFDDIIELLIKYDVCDVIKVSTESDYVADIKFRETFVISLFGAVKANKYDTVKHLLKSRQYINIDYTDKSDYKPRSILSMACQYSDLKMVKLLVESGADVEPSNPYGEYYRSPIYIAIEGRKNSIVKYLLNNGSNFDMDYIIKGDILYNKGCNIREIINSKYLEYGEYPDMNRTFSSLGIRESILSLSVGRCDIDIIEYLINVGADVDGPDYENIVIPIVQAIEFHRDDVFELLMSYGANIHINFEYQGHVINLLNLACMYENEYLVELFIKHGVRFDHHHDKQGESDYFNSDNYPDNIRDILKVSNVMEHNQEYVNVNYNFINAVANGRLGDVKAIMKKMKYKSRQLN